MKGKRMLHKFVDWIGMGGSTGGLACGGAEGIGQRNPTPGEGFSEGAEHHVSCVASRTLGWMADLDVQLRGTRACTCHCLVGADLVMRALLCNVQGIVLINL